jgi:hypothetical protein
MTDRKDRSCLPAIPARDTGCGEQQSNHHPEQLRRLRLGQRVVALHRRARQRKEDPCGPRVVDSIAWDVAAYGLKKYLEMQAGIVGPYFSYGNVYEFLVS